MISRNIFIKKLQKLPTSAILGGHGVAEEPVLAAFAVVAGCVLQTLLTEAAEPVARVGVTHVDVVVALARLAESTCNRFLKAVIMPRPESFVRLFA